MNGSKLWACVVLTQTLAFAASPPPPVSTLTMAADLGITPHSLIVAGVATSGPAPVHAVLGALHDAEPLRQKLASTRIEIDAMSTMLLAYEEALQLQSDDVELLWARAQLQAELSMQIDVASGIEQQMLDVALSGVDPDAATLILQWRNGVGLAFPSSLRASLRADDEWDALARALRAETRAIRTGVPLAEEHATVLAQVRAEPAVAVAEQNLLLYGTYVKQLFSEYLED